VGHDPGPVFPSARPSHAPFPSLLSLAAGTRASAPSSPSPSSSPAQRPPMSPASPFPWARAPGCRSRPTKPAASLGFPLSRRRAPSAQTLAPSTATAASFGSPPRRLLAAFRRRPSTAGLPRWGKDPPPPLFPLGLASPRPRALAGVPEPHVAVAPPLRPI
jgi:hypothetical protein